MAKPKMPRGARRLRTYAEFQSYLVDFVAGRYPFLWVVGRPGVAKTESLRAAVRGKKIYYCKGGQLTPAQFYIDCYRHRGQAIILDDAEHLLDNKIGTKLLLALGDTSSAKLLSYATTSRALGDIPPSFHTTSALCILANRITADEAALSRAVTLYFDPTNLEIHRAVATWFWSQAIHDWFGRHLHVLPPLDVRWYVVADQDWRAGRDWQQIILTTHVPDRASCVVQALEGDAAYPTREDKARRFVEHMANTKGASRATYFRVRRRLEDVQRLIPDIVPPIQLSRTRAPAAPSLLELESMETSQSVQPEEEPRLLDVPLRGEFAQPVRGDVAALAPPAPVVLDDTLPWERPERPDDEE